MNKYIVISSVIPVIPQSCRVCSNLKFVQIPWVLHFCSNSWNSLGFCLFCIVFAKVLPGHPLLVALWPCSEHHGNWARRSFASELQNRNDETKKRHTNHRYHRLVYLQKWEIPVIISWEKERKTKNLHNELSCFGVRFQTFWKVWPLLVIGAVQGARASSQVGSIFTSRRCVVGCLGCLGCGVVWSETSETMKTSIQTAPGDLPYEQQHWTAL